MSAPLCRLGCSTLQDRFQSLWMGSFQRSVDKWDSQSSRCRKHRSEVHPVQSREPCSLLYRSTFHLSRHHNLTVKRRFQSLSGRVLRHCSHCSGERSQGWRLGEQCISCGDRISSGRSEGRRTSHASQEVSELSHNLSNQTDRRQLGSWLLGSTSLCSRNVQWTLWCWCANTKSESVLPSWLCQPNFWFSTHSSQANGYWWPLVFVSPCALQR